MPDVVTCPVCGARFSGADEHDTCPACLEPLQRIHERPRGAMQELLSSPDLTGPQRAIDEIMRRNRGIDAP